MCHLYCDFHQRLNTKQPWRVNIHILNMPKELPNTNDPPDVFQMFNEHRTFYFESDISSLPNLPCTLHEPVARRAAPRLLKSFSQPQLHLTSSESAYPRPSISITTTTTTTTTQPSSGNLHLPAAIMASTAHQVPFPTHSSGDGRVVDGSVQGRYRTEPSYSSSNILKSFRHEFQFFGHSVKKTSASAPSSPRRSSSPDIQIPAELVEAQQLAKSSADARKLSLVREELEKDVNIDTRGLWVVQRDSESTESKSRRKPSELLKSTAKDSVNVELPNQSHSSLTKQMMTWFVTPQKPSSSKTSRAEFNAVTPSSF